MALKLSVKDGSIDLSKPRLMAVLNVTPDSFSDGGRYRSIEDAVHEARTFASEGADIIDIGAESTRPGHTPLSVEEELARLLPVLEQVVAEKLLPVSVDTYKAKTAEAAIKSGAAIVNDVWGLSRDPDMAQVVADHGAGLVIMHNRETRDETVDIVTDMVGFFAIALDRAAKAGIRPDCIGLDPGIGFGKTVRQNLLALKATSALMARFELPVLVGASRKSFINAIHASPVTERLGGTLAAHLFAVRQGAAILRVHDVMSHVQALAVENAIIRAS